MKLAIALALCSSLAFADDKPVRKVEPPADKLAAAAGEAFAKAKAADEAGKLDEAERLYRKAIAIAPHPHTYYNLADVQRRDKDISGAIASYRKYLELDPAAKDRVEVEKVIAGLEAMPGTIIIEIEDESSDMLVFMDGEPLRRGSDPKNPYVIDMSVGDHVVDVISPLSHDNETCRAFHGSKRTCRMRLKPREDGNVVISGPSSMSRASIGRSGQPTIRFKGRFPLDPGPHDIWVSRERQCTPLKLNVAKGDSVVTYLWADVPKKWPDKRKPDGKPECADVKFKQRVLKF